MPDLRDHEERIERTERNLDRLTLVVDRMAVKTNRLDEAMAVLAEAQIALAESQIKTEERFRESAKRSAALDIRVDKLVSAIGEFIRIQPSTH